MWVDLLLIYQNKDTNVVDIISNYANSESDLNDKYRIIIQSLKSSLPTLSNKGVTTLQVWKNGIEVWK